MVTAAAAAAGDVRSPDPRPAIRAGGGFGFGLSPRPRRRVAVAGGKSDADLIAEYLRHNEVKKGPPRFADGSVRESGTYQF